MSDQGIEDDGSLLSLNDTSYSFSHWVPAGSATAPAPAADNHSKHSPDAKDSTHSTHSTHSKHAAKDLGDARSERSALSPFVRTPRVGTPSKFDPTRAKSSTPARIMNQNVTAASPSEAMASFAAGILDPDDEPDAEDSPMTAQELRGRMGALKRDNFNLKLRIFYLEERLSSGGGDGANLEADLVSMRVRCEQLSRQIDARNGVLQRARDTIRTLESRTANHESERKDLERRVAELSASCEKLRAENGSLKAERAGGESSMVSMQRKVRELESQLEQARSKTTIQTSTTTQRNGADPEKTAEKTGSQGGFGAQIDMPRELAVRDRLIRAERSKSEQLAKDLQHAKSRTEACEAEKRALEQKISALEGAKSLLSDRLNSAAETGESAAKRYQSAAQRATEKCREIERAAERAVADRNALLTETLDEIRRVASSPSSSSGGGHHATLANPFRASGGGLLPDPAFLSDPSPVHDGAPLVSRLAEDGDKLARWRESASQLLSRVKHSGHSIESINRSVRAAEEKFARRIEQVMASAGARQSSLERRLASAEQELQVALRARARRSLGLERQSPTVATAQPPRSLQSALGFGDSPREPLAPIATDPVANTASEQKRVHFSGSAAAPAKPGKDTSPAADIRRRLDALAEHNRLLVLELEDRRAQAEVKEREFSTLKAKVKEAGVKVKVARY